MWSSPESEIEGQTGLNRTYLNNFWSLAELTIAEQLSKCLLAPIGALIGILVYYWFGNFFQILSISANIHSFFSF